MVLLDPYFLASPPAAFVPPLAVGLPVGRRRPRVLLGVVVMVAVVIVLGVVVVRQGVTAALLKNQDKLPYMGKDNSLKK